MNFFTENKQIGEIYTKLGYVFSNNSMLQNENSIVKTFNEDVYTYPTFKDMVFPSKEDISLEEIQAATEATLIIKDPKIMGLE